MSSSTDDEEEEGEGEGQSHHSVGSPNALGDVTMTTAESDSDLSNLELIFTPPPEPASRRHVHVDHSPLFVRLSTLITSNDNKEKYTQNIVGGVSLCLGKSLPISYYHGYTYTFTIESLFPGKSKPGTDTRWTLSVTIEAFSMLERQDEREVEDKRYGFYDNCGWGM